ncbi:MAG TPA: DUF4293 domain-containing protein [Chitinophagales bacterium]|nr:DUF4293 domain-containing protein [Chitinophagales bacterium]
MIQRIQTVFLLLAIIALGLFLYFPLLRFESNHFVQEFRGWEVYYRYNGSLSFLRGYLYYVNLILTGTALGLTLISIFMFKNRSLQMLLCWFALIFTVFALGFVYYQYQTWVFMGFVVLRKWALFAILAMVFQVLAIFFIRRDEELLKSVDRLR